MAVTAEGVANLTTSMRPGGQKDDLQPTTQPLSPTDEGNNFLIYHQAAQQRASGQVPPDNRHKRYKMSPRPVSTANRGSSQQQELTTETSMITRGSALIRKVRDNIKTQLQAYLNYVRHQHEHLSVG